MLTTGYPRYRGDLFGVFIHELARELQLRGLPTSVVAPHEAGLPRGESVDGVRVSRFRYLVPASWQRLAYGSGIPANLRQRPATRLQVLPFLAGFSWRAWRETRACQVVHCHWTVTGLVGWCCTLGRRKHLVLSVRGSDLNLADRRLAALMNRLVFRLVDAIVVVSQALRDTVIELGVPASKVRVIPNGVSDRFSPQDRTAVRAQLGLWRDGTVAGFVGLLAPVKGLDVLIDAMARLEGADLHLVVVGEGAVRGELEQQIARLGLDRRVRLVGQRPAAEVPAWLNACDFLVLPSHSEGRPNVVLEAMSCGTPVVATRVGGTPELVEDGVTGLLVEPADPDDLARALGEMASDPVARADMGRRGREWIMRQGLTWPACAAAHLQLYQQLIDGQAPCAA